MNLQLECQGKVLDFKGVSDLADLKTRLNTCEPSFVLETLTYLDEDNDVITVINDEDFACLLSSTIATVQAIGQQDFNKKNDIKIVDLKSEISVLDNEKGFINSEKEQEKNLLLQKRLEQKVKFFKEQQKVYLKNRRDLYQQKLDLINSGKKEIKELKIKEKQLQQQIPEQLQIIKQNDRIKIKITPKQDLDKTTIYKDILDAENKINYDEENINHFRRQMYYLELALCEKFTNAYQTRLDKFIALRQKRRNAISKLDEIKSTLKDIQLQIKSKIRSTDRKELYYIQKLMAVKSLLKKL